MFRKLGLHPLPAAKLRLFSPMFLARKYRTQNEARIRALCASAYVGGDTAVCRVLGRYKLYVDTQDFGLSVHLMMDGYWEMWLTEVIARTVRPGMLAVDVGANLGYFSVLMADLVGGEGRVHAFEPNAALAARLRKSVTANGFGEMLTVHQTALGDVDGALFHLVIPENDPKNGFLTPAGEGSDAFPDVLAVRRLDSYPELLDLDVIKIDADTAEPAIWRGMRGIFDRGRAMTIFLEFNNARYAAPRDFLAEITAEGFSLARIDLDSGIKSCTVEEIVKVVGNQDQLLVIRR